MKRTWAVTQLVFISGCTVAEDGWSVTKEMVVYAGRLGWRWLVTAPSVVLQVSEATAPCQPDWARHHFTAPRFVRDQARLMCAHVCM